MGLRSPSACGGAAWVTELVPLHRLAVSELCARPGDGRYGKGVRSEQERVRCLHLSERSRRVDHPAYFDSVNGRSERITSGCVVAKFAVAGGCRR